MDAAESVNYSLRTKYLATSETQDILIMYCPLTYTKNIDTPLLRTELGNLKDDLAILNEKWHEINRFGIAWKSEDNIHKIIQKEYGKQRRQGITYQTREANFEHRRKRRANPVDQHAKRRKPHLHVPLPDNAPTIPEAESGIVVQNIVPITVANTTRTTHASTKETTTHSEQTRQCRSASTTTTTNSAQSSTNEQITTSSRSTRNKTQAFPTKITIHNQTTDADTNLQYRNTTQSSITNHTTIQHEDSESDSNISSQNPAAPEGQPRSKSIFASLARRTMEAASLFAERARSTLTTWRNPQLLQHTTNNTKDTLNRQETNNDTTHGINKQAAGSHSVQETSPSLSLPKPIQLEPSVTQQSPRSTPLQSHTSQPSPPQGTTSQHHNSDMQSRLREVARDTLRARTTYYTREFHTTAVPINRYTSANTNKLASTQNNIPQLAQAATPTAEIPADSIDNAGMIQAKHAAQNAEQRQDNNVGEQRSHTMAGSPETPSGITRARPGATGIMQGDQIPSRARQPPTDPWASFVIQPDAHTHISNDTPAIQNQLENDIHNSQDTPQNTTINNFSTPSRQKWTEQETQALLAGIRKYGTARWTKIYDENREIFKNRDPVKLKDKFRNLVRRPEFENLADDYSRNKRRRTKK